MKVSGWINWKSFQSRSCRWKSTRFGRSWEQFCKHYSWKLSLKRFRFCFWHRNSPTNMERFVKICCRHTSPSTNLLEGERKLARQKKKKFYHETDCNLPLLFCRKKISPQQESFWSKEVFSLSTERHPTLFIATRSFILELNGDLVEENVWAEFNLSMAWMRPWELDFPWFQRCVWINIGWQF